MTEWNVLITVHEPHFREALELLAEFGQVHKTGYFNVLAMEVEDPHRLMEKLREKLAAHPGLLTVLARVVPAARVFNFQKTEDFEEKAKEIALGWVPELRGKKFHVRMHRRGLKGRLSSLQEETFLDRVLMDALDRTGNPGSITFDDPDLILSLETIGQRAGLSLWTRDDLKRYPFLRVD